MRACGDPSPGTGDTNVPTITIIANRTTQKQRRSRPGQIPAGHGVLMVLGVLVPVTGVMTSQWLPAHI